MGSSWLALMCYSINLRAVLAVTQRLSADLVKRFWIDCSCRTKMKRLTDNDHDDD